jgi:hypothetical protein
MSLKSIKNACTLLVVSQERREKEAAEARARDVSFKRLLSLQRPEWPWMVVGCISAALAGDWRVWCMGDLA